MTSWHTQNITSVKESLDADLEKGLSQQTAERRQNEYGLNELIETGGKGPWRILLSQFAETMVIVLIVAAVVSYFVGDLKDALVILLIVILNAILGFTQEYRAEQAMAALKRMAAPIVKVRRDGQIKEIESRELVPGDVVLLETGDAIPADGRVIESVNLRVEEASLTGESHAVDKHIDELEGDDLPLGDRGNMVFSGTAVTYGRGQALIVETGMSTQLGQIAELIQSVGDEQTPLQRRMGELGKWLAIIAGVIVAVVFGLGLLRGEDPAEMFLTAIAMAVAAIPEGLPAVVTIALALGAQRMLRRRALIRKLPAVETLGSVTTICSDKTGTLTENRMTVTILDVMGETDTIEALLKEDIPVVNAELHAGNKSEIRSLGLLIKSAALVNDATLSQVDESPGDFRAIGDPTEGAIVVAAAQLGLWKQELDDRWPRVAEAPFTSERKRMTTIHQTNVGVEESDAPWRTSPYVAFTKGAPDGLLEISSQVWAGDNPVDLDDDMRQRILQANEKFAKDGQRVLGVAFRPLEDNIEKVDSEKLEQDLIFIGLLAMLDPPRQEVERAVATAKRAGIRPVMITGDHPLTAQRIAYDLGIASDGNDRVITGQELSAMNTQELENLVEEIPVFARVSPEHKLRIVEALQNKGHIVAMTGDGVNDAPALRKSDIGVAMGITGTDVSKEAADMVITDDNFATIVAAIEEGRTIYDNVRKFIKYTLTSNAGEILVMLFAPFIGLPLPLTALQILWINLVTDGLPGLALAVEAPEKNTMTRKPYSPGESIMGRGLGSAVLWVGLLMGAVSLGMGLWAFSIGLPDWRTMIFNTLTLSQMGNAMAIRSERESLFSQGIFSNKAMIGAVSLTFLLQLAVIYWGPLQSIFGTNPLTGFEFIVSLLASVVVFIGVEIEKWFRRRRDQQASA
ncbi:MAG: cation-translocating P-type ATPase [Chloroflexi bacterium]|nr:MAG: cation-translocating P-type ATPase [Chloroflexota bacterium]MBL1193769.1 cation-translocating P-type ATPase [Chloroflexota bacterium]NOH11062.1 cation-translocating P-type ATPase [Chloroflexota bacterium]